VQLERSHLLHLLDVELLGRLVNLDQTRVPLPAGGRFELVLLVDRG